MTELALTVLAENTAGTEALASEHGLSLWIRHNSRAVLFDTGAGRAMGANARALGIDLATADAVVLSHGHYDHSGGLEALLDDLPGRPVYLHPDALGVRYSCHPGREPRAVGMAAALSDRLATWPGLQWVLGPTELPGGLLLTGPVPRGTDFEDTGGPFFMDPDARQADPLHDDQAAVIDTPEGLVVITGCAHSGVVNTLRYVRQLTAGRPIRALLGGLHLRSASDERMQRTLDELQRLNLAAVHPCHCTGQAAVKQLQQAFGRACQTITGGQTLEF